MSAYSQPFSFKLSVLVRCLSVVLLMGSSTVYAEVVADEMDINGISKEFQVTLPTIIIESTSDQKQTLGYNKYHQASITRGEMAVKDVPQTIETINVQKNKLYGTNDLSSIVEGNAGIDATYDMRGESINIRGFSADASDIYLDGIRSSGQVRRSTANV
ncbi:TonB-dependent receptor plug domain-containing protein [Moraxella lincolnii]